MTLYLLHFPSFVSLIFEGNSINKKSFSQETNNKIEKIRGFYSYIITNLWWNIINKKIQDNKFIRFLLLHFIYSLYSTDSF